LGLWDTISVIVGVVIGAGIYETAPLVLASVPDARTAGLVWAAGGLLSLIGAACYAELASAYPRSGGDYVYLSRAFGRCVGFLFGWAQLTVILTGSIGMMAYVFAEYAASIWGLGRASVTGLAVASVFVLTAVHAVSVGVGKHTQNALSALKVASVGLIVASGVAMGLSSDGRAPVEPMTSREPSLGLALIFVHYTFGGWNDAAFVAAEVRRPGRNLPRALLYGMAAITGIYLLMNGAFVLGLGFEGARSSKAVAADLLRAAFGPIGGAVMAVVVMVSALGALSGLVFTGARLFASVGADHPLLSLLGRRKARTGAPLGALAVQLVVTVCLVSLIGTGAGRVAVERAVAWVGLAAPTWSGHGGFDTLLRATAPVFWVFFLMTGLSLFVLRFKDPSRRRPFRVPGYPVIPLLFCATCVFMVHAAVSYAGALALLGAAPLALGLPLYWLSKWMFNAERNESCSARIESEASSS
jgi:amino acid transporter